MSREIGNYCKNIVSGADSMINPCIQLTPQNSFSLKDMAKAFYLVNECVSEVLDMVGINFNINLTESALQVNLSQCKMNPSGFHELYEMKKKGLPSGVMMCIHCGQLMSISKKSQQEIDDIINHKVFDDEKIVGDKAELPF